MRMRQQFVPFLQNKVVQKLKLSKNVNTKFVLLTNILKSKSFPEKLIQCLTEKNDLENPNLVLLSPMHSSNYFFFKNSFKLESFSSTMTEVEIVANMKKN